MNAPFALSSERVRAVDLRQPDEVTRIEGFVAEMRGSVFHRPAWLNAVERGTGQRARGLMAEKAGAITGWLPLSEVHSPVFGRLLASSGFAVEGGVLAERETTATALCRAAEEYAVRLSCSTIELRGGTAPGAKVPAMVRRSPERASRLHTARGAWPAPGRRSGSRGDQAMARGRAAFTALPGETERMFANQA